MAEMKAVLSERIAVVMMEIATGSIAVDKLVVESDEQKDV